MKHVKVLGSGCRRCIATAAMIETEAARLGVPVSVEKVTDYAAIAGYGAMSTPASSSTASWCTPAACRGRKTSPAGLSPDGFRIVRLLSCAVAAMPSASPRRRARRRHIRSAS